MAVMHVQPTQYAWLRLGDIPLTGIRELPFIAKNFRHRAALVPMHLERSDVDAVGQIHAIGPVLVFDTPQCSGDGL